jgi:RNA polymerase sigma factor (sigma-70 family)
VAFEKLVGRFDEVVDEPDDVTAVHRVLERHLTPEERSLLILRYVHEFNAKELAAACERSPEAIRQRLARAKAKLAAALEEEKRSGSDSGR